MESSVTGLATISEACRILATCTDLSEIKEIKNKAEAVRQYLKASGESLEAQNKAAEIRLRAERRAGELLATMDRREQGRVSSKGNTTLPLSLSDIGITKIQSSRWQLAATVPEKSFVSLVDACAATGRELTSSSLLKIARDLVREDVRREEATRVDDEPIDDASERLDDIIRMVCEWWPEDHSKTLPNALREIAERIEQGGTRW